MIKLGKETIFALAAEHDPEALHHVAFNNFFNSGGYVTSNGLLNMRLAKIEARMNSENYRAPKRSKIQLSVFV